MNSFKKIALVLVATMTMGTMSMIPANASVSTSLLVGGAPVATGTVAANPALINVPADNSVDAADALEIEVTGLAVGTVVTANVVGGRIVPALATPTVPVTSGSGVSSLSINTGTGTSAEFFVFTTAASAGAVSITIGGNVTTYYFRGVAGPLHSISLTAPASAASGTVEKVTLSASDIFGNPKGGEVITLQVITTTSTSLAWVTESATTPTTVLGAKTVDVNIPTSGNVTLVATASVAPAYLGLPAPVGVVIKSITVRDLMAELTAVRAELAAEKAAHEATKKAAADAAAKASEAAAKAAADLAKALSDAAAAKEASDKLAAETKAVNDAAMAKLTAQIASLEKALATLKKKYNIKAKKFKFTPVA